MTNSKGMRIYYDGEGGTGGNSGTLLNGGSSGTGAGTGGGGAGGTGGEGNKTGDGGSGSAFKLPDGWDYRTVLPETLKESPSAKKYNSIEELVRGFDMAQQFIGRPTEHLVDLPPNASPEAQRAALEKMGLPKDIAGYKVEAPKDNPDVIKIDHPNFKALTETAHKLGVLPGQFQGMIDAFAGMVTKGQAEMAQGEIQRNADNITAIKTKWGEAFDGKVAAANFAVEKLGGKELRESINRSGLGTDAPLLEMLAKVGEMLGEDEGGGDKPNFNTGPTPDAAKDEATRLLQQAIDEPNLTKRRDLEKRAQELFAKAAKK